LDNSLLKILEISCIKSSPPKRNGRWYHIITCKLINGREIDYDYYRHDIEPFMKINHIIHAYIYRDSLNNYEIYSVRSCNGIDILRFRRGNFVS